jgi:toxin ParE1/3/4
VEIEAGLANRPFGQGQNLFRIYHYIEERSPNAAEAFIRRLNTNFENLVRFPFIGQERSSVAPGLRCLVVGLYLIFYTVELHHIAIVRVIDGRMDVDEEFHR